MPQFNLQSAVVMVVAIASSLTTAWWMNNFEDRGQAQAAAMIAPTPSTASARPPGAAQIQRAADGHYWAEADIDGRAIRVLVDTGASVVALTRADALRLGLKLKPEDFDKQVQTASGPARAAAVRLAHVAIAGARVEAVQALVVEEGLEHSLLGMSYLGRLSRFEATPHALTLRP